MAGDPSLTPELIQARSFSSGFRGYDQSEVRDFLGRVGTEVRSLRDRADQLESSWHAAEERAARPPVLDEETLVAAVGEETASILRAARSAAAEMRLRAEQDAARVVAEAEERAGRIRAEAEGVLGRETRAAEEAALRIADSANAQAGETVEKAKTEAAAIRAAAEQERMLTIEGAISSRERILEDLSRRRRVASVQIEQLRAGRERLLECYAVVRRTLEEVNDQLNRADAEARAAADEVGRRMQREHRTEPVRPSTTAEPADTAPKPAAVLIDEPSPTEVARSESTQAEAPEAEAPEAEAPEAEAPKTGASAAEATETEVPKADAATADAPAAEEGAAPGSQVERLFARIRAGRTEAPEAPTNDDEGVKGARAPSLNVSEDGESRLSHGDEALLQRRESAVIDLEVALTRKLKRTLQDEQNGLLDRLRGLGDEPTAERLLLEAAAQIDRYASAAQPLVDQAAAAGVAFAHEALGREGQAPAGPPDVEDVAREAATTIVESLRRRLEHAISASGGDDQAGLVEAVGSAYREWKSERIERVAGDVLAAAFSRGTWSEVPEGTLLRWVVEDTDGPCPDCDDDALAGGLPKGEVFPTGQPYPPAHTGCRCLLVPIGH